MEYNELVLKKKEKEKGDTIEIDEDRLMDVSIEDGVFMVNGDIGAVQVRGGGDFKGEALYLSSYYDWVLGIDDLGVPVLVPLKQ